MGTVLTVTTPIYLIIGAGFFAVRWRWMAQPDLRVLGRFVAQICVPALLFNAISHQSLGAVLNADYLAVYAGGSLITLTAVTIAARHWGRRPTAYAALQGLGASGSNSGFVGYPIVLAALGPIAAVALALGMLVENLVVMPLSLAIADSASLGQPRADALRAVAAGWIRNPMIVAIAAGLVVSAVGLPLPVVIERSVALVAAAAPPTALFVIGGSLVGLQLAGIRRDIVGVVAGKLLLHPLCVGALMILSPPDDPALRAAAVLYAAMPMMSIYPVLAQKYGHERFAAAALLAATVASYFTISALIWLLPADWVARH